MKRVLDLYIPPRTAEVATARRSLAALEGLVSGESLEQLRLLVTELVTNAVRHAGLADTDRIGLRIFVSGGTVRVEVEDPGRGFEAPDEPEPDSDQASGWGLYLMANMTDRWGVENRTSTENKTGEERKTLVWFELEGSGTRG